MDIFSVSQVGNALFLFLSLGSFLLLYFNRLTGLRYSIYFLQLSGVFWSYYSGYSFLGSFLSFLLLIHIFFEQRMSGLYFSSRRPEISQAFLYLALSLGFGLLISLHFESILTKSPFSSVVSVSSLGQIVLEAICIGLALALVIFLITNNNLRNK